MADIYGKLNAVHNVSVITSEEVKLLTPTLGSGSFVAGQYLLQDVSIDFNEQTIPIYEIGSERLMLIPGKSMGVCQIGRIVGTKTIEDIFDKFGTGMWSSKTADASKKTITFSAIENDGTGGGLGFKLEGCKIENYGISINAQGVMLQERVTIKFSSLVATNSG